MNMANFFLELLCSAYYSIDVRVLLEIGLWVHYGEYLFIPRVKFEDGDGETNRHRGALLRCGVVTTARSLWDCELATWVHARPWRTLIAPS